MQLAHAARILLALNIQTQLGTAHKLIQILILRYQSAQLKKVSAGQPTYTNSEISLTSLKTLQLEIFKKAISATTS